MIATWKPALTRRVILRYDTLRNVDLLIAPERVAKLNPTAAAILRLLNGSRSVQEIVTALQKTCAEPVPEHEVTAFLDRVRVLQWVE